jgi:flagellar motor switch protein FliN/FliY
MPMADDSQRIDQDEIERLLQQARSSDPAPPPSAPQAQPASSKPPGQSDVLGQSDVEALFQQQASGQQPSAARQPAAAQGAATAPARPAAKPAAAAAARDDGVAQADIELLLQQAERAIASIDEPQSEQPLGVGAFQLEDFVGAPPNTERATLDLIRDVELDLKIEFGRTHMYLEDILKLRKGSVVPLDKLAGDPVDIFVNGRLIAKGEVLVLNDNFCVRVAELIAGEAAG